MKIAVVRPGIHTLDEQFCYFLAKQGFSVTLVAPENSFATPNKLNNPNFKVVQLPAVNFFKLGDFPIVWGLFHFLKKGDFDIIQSNEDFQCVTWIACLSAKLNRKRFFLIEEKYRYPRFRFHRIFFTLFRKIFCPFVWNNSEKIICHGKICYRFMKKSINNPVLEKKLTILPVGVNTDIFRKISVNKPGKTLRVISVGRLIANKDFSTLIRAIHRVTEQEISVQLTIVGDGPERSRLTELIHQYGLEENVRMIKNIPYEELYAEYSKHDVFVLPSKLEIVGAVVSEAMACGLPVIVSHVGGMLDYVSGDNGYTFTPGNDRELAERLKIFTDKQRVRYLGEGSLKLVNQFFDWNVLIQKYSGIFARLS